MIPLTLRAMFETRLRRPRNSGLPAALLLSVLAVLALACAPAQAREASELQYEPEVPTVPQEESPGATHRGGSNGGNEGGGPNAENSTAPPGGGSGGGGNGSQGGGSHTGQSNQAPAGNGGQPGSGAVGSGVALGEGNDGTELGEKTSATSDEGSSPLVPILIAIVVLAAISIGAFYYRQRRQGAGSSISPKAS
jgi:cobalamin biosynthesis Mg chelatase CobN